MSATEQRTTYSSHVVWEDDDGENYYMHGHVKPERHAIAAANYYARRECGLINLADDKNAPLSWVTVRYIWVRQDPADEERYLDCASDHPLAHALTVVSV